MNQNVPKSRHIECAANDLEVRQLELEAEMLAQLDNKSDYLDSVYQATGRHPLTDAVPALAEAIRNQVASTFTGRGNRKHPCSKLAHGVDEWDVKPKTAARLTLRTPLQTLGDGKFHGMTKLAKALGCLIMESRCSGNYQLVEEDCKAERELTALGGWLLDLAALTTELFSFPTERIYGKSYKTQRKLKFHPDIQTWVNAKHGGHELLLPKYWPMVVPPRPWSTPNNGGYLRRKLPLVKHARQAYLDGLATHDGVRDEPLTEVYTALNAIQEVPWRINRRLLNAMQQAVHVNPEQLDSEELKLPIVKPKLAVAEMLEHEERIYFPHQLDWRGRIYPVPRGVDPITDDPGRALLEFANGKPLGEHGVEWLTLHIANLYDVKGTLEERRAWVDERSRDLLASAQAPFEGRPLWQKADKPWRFLAACFEWEGYCEEGIAHVCHLPVSVDGTCNGYQHLSAMLRDTQGGRATNVLPSNVPQDIYGEVAQAVKRRVDVSNDPDVSWWHSQKIDRKLLKSPVMTVPYGVTDEGMRAKLLETLEKSGIEDDCGKQCSALISVIRDSIAEVVPAASNVMKFLEELGSTLWKVDGSHVYWTTPVGFPVLQYKPKTKAVEVKYTVAGKRRKLQLRCEIPGSVNTRKHASGIAANFVHGMDAAHLVTTVNRLLKEGVTDFTFVHDSYGTHPADMPVLNRCLREAFVEQYSQDILHQLTATIQEQWVEYGEPTETNIDWGDGSPVVAVPSCNQVKPPPHVQKARESVEIPEPEDPLDIRDVLESRYFFS